MKHVTKLSLALIFFLAVATAQAQQGMGVGNNNPLEMLDVSGAIKVGTDINNSNAAPTGGAGTIRFKAGAFQGWDGTSWIPLGGGADTDWTISGNDQYSAVSGRVGIGESSPDAKLHVSSSSTGDATGIKLTQGTANSLIYHNSNNDLIIRKAGQSDQLVIDNGGSIGIGTSTPANRLHVVGKIRMVDGNQDVGYIPVSDANGTMTWTNPTTITTAADGDGNSSNELQTLLQSGTDVTLSNGGGTISVADNDNDASNEIQALSISGNDISLSNGGGTVSVPNDGDWTVSGNDQYSAVSGKVGIGESSPDAKLHVSSSSIGDATGIKLTQGIANSLIYHNSDNDLIMRKAAQFDQLVLDNGGNVGVGTSTPGNKLHVDGAIRMIDGNQAAGYIPVSDASGTMVWTDPTTITAGDDGDWTVSGSDIYNANTGKVGIGDATPKWPLTVSSSNELFSSTDVIDPDLYVLTVTRPDGTNDQGIGIGFGGSNSGDHAGAGIAFKKTGNNSLGDLMLTVKSNAASFGPHFPALTVKTLSGNVGIGVNPTEKLHVDGDVLFDRNIGGANTERRLTIAGKLEGGVNPYASINFQNFDFNSAATDYTGASIRSHNNGSSDDGDLRFFTTSDQVVTEAMRIDHDGNVGIGTTSPGEKLVVEGRLRTNNPGSSPDGSNIILGSPANDVGITMNRGNGSGGSQQRWDIKIDNDNSIRFRSENSNDYFTFSNTGNLGVGTNTPTEVVHVEGSIRMVDGNQAVGYIPISDASGTMTWTDPTTISTSNDGDWTISGNDQYSAVSGKVGIGTTTPDNKLQVVGNASIGADNQANTGPNSLIVGVNVSNTGQNSIIGGNSHTVTGTHTLVSGYNHTVAADNSVVLNNSNSNTSAATNSLVGGFNSSVSGQYGFAFGLDNIASGEGAVAFGRGNESSGDYSFAANSTNTASGIRSAAFGQQNEASGSESFAIGSTNTVTGDMGMSTGYGNTVSGQFAFAMGQDNQVSQNGSSALGKDNQVSGQFATGFGRSVRVRSYGETVVGTYNTDYTANNATSINASDRVFVVGNGTSGGARSNAMTILKNGNVGIGSDIPLDELHVVGSVRMVDGNEAAGFIPVSDANGTMVWTDPTTISDGDWTISGNDIYNSNTGNVGVGTSTPSTILSLDGDANRTIGMERTTGTDGFDLTIQAGGAKAGTADNDGGNLILSGGIATGNGSVVPKSNIIFKTTTQLGSSSSADQNPTEKMRLTANGDLGLGTTNPSALLHISSAASGDADGIKLTQGIANSLIYHNSDNDLILRKAAQTDQLVLDNNGEVGVGTDAPTSKFHVTDNFSNAGVFVTTIENTGNGAYSNGLEIKAGQNTQSVNNRFISFVKPNGTEIGAVRQNTSASVSFNTTSDERLKTNIQPTSKGLNDLMQIEVKDYVYKEDMDKPQTGFIAQQVYAHYPNAVSLGGDDVKTDPWMMDYGKLTPLLVKAVQDLTKLVEEQQKRIEELEAANR